MTTHRQILKQGLQFAQRQVHSAFAAWKLERWEEANQIYIQASRLEAPPLSLFDGQPEFAQFTWIGGSRVKSHGSLTRPL